MTYGTFAGPSGRSSGQALTGDWAIMLSADATIASEDDRGRRSSSLRAFSFDTRLTWPRSAATGLNPALKGAVRRTATSGMERVGTRLAASPTVRGG
ncbi:hypothetical protein GCM10023334_115490 [Nonomuraea thailandensis]